MSRRLPFALLIVLAVGPGCDDDDDDDTTIIDPSTGVDGGLDAGALGDAGAVEEDAGVDAGGDAGLDGGAEDAGPIDAGPSVACTGTYEGHTSAEVAAALSEGACATGAQVVELCQVNPAAQAATAGQTCFLNGQSGDDLIECVVEGGFGTDGVRDVAPSLNDACLACYADAVRCSAENCLLSCAQNPNGAACIACRDDAGCTSDFYDCSGLPAPEDL